MTGSDSIGASAAYRPATQGGRDRPIDQWLRKSLSNAFDGVLSENLPEAWLSLIERKRLPDRDK